MTLWSRDNWDSEGFIWGHIAEEMPFRKNPDFEFILTIFLLPSPISFKTGSKKHPVPSWADPHSSPEERSPSRSPPCGDMQWAPHGRCLWEIMTQMKWRNIWPFVEITYLVTSFVFSFSTNSNNLEILLFFPQTCASPSISIVSFPSYHGPTGWGAITPILWMKKLRLRVGCESWAV